MYHVYLTVQCLEDQHLTSGWPNEIGNVLQVSHQVP